MRKLKELSREELEKLCVQLFEDNLYHCTLLARYMDKFAKLRWELYELDWTDKKNTTS